MVEEARVLELKTAEVKPSYELKDSYDSQRGLKSVSLTINSGFPDQYLGEYVLTEWNYGEKLRVELEAENIRNFKLQQTISKLATTPEDVKLKSERDRLEKQDIESLIILQTVTTIRKAPINLETIDDYVKLPGRLGTLLSNITGYLNMTPNEEKKS